MTQRLIAVALLCAAAAAPAAAEVLQKRYDVGPGGRLEIVADVGSIDIDTSGSAVDIEVDLRGRAAELLEVRMERVENTVVVRAELPEQYRRGGDMGDLRVRFDLRIPSVFDVEARTRGGSVSVGSLQGELTVGTAGGSISLGDTTGTVRAKTAGGSISAGSAGGDTELTTAGGSISVGDVAGTLAARTAGGSIDIGRVAGAVVARTAGGSISIDEAGGAIEASTAGGSVRATFGAQPAGPSALSTNGGSVAVYLPDFIAVDIEAETSWGKIRNELELEMVRSGKRYLSGKLNGGGPELRLEGSGGVSIRRR